MKIIYILIAVLALLVVLIIAGWKILKYVMKPFSKEHK